MDRHRHTDTRDVTTIHFALSTTHVKCNDTGGIEQQQQSFNSPLSRTTCVCIKIMAKEIDKQWFSDAGFLAPFMRMYYTLDFRTAMITLSSSPQLRIIKQELIRR